MNFDIKEFENAFSTPDFRFSDEAPVETKKEDDMTGYTFKSIDEDGREVEVDFDGEGVAGEFDYYDIDDDGNVTIESYDNTEEVEHDNDIPEFNGGNIFEAPEDYEFDLGEIGKVDKSTLIESVRLAEANKQLSSVFSSVGADMVEYENMVRDIVEGNRFITEKTLIELNQKLRSGLLSSSEKADVYEQIEIEKHKQRILENHLSAERSKREHALTKANQARVQATASALLGSYRWDIEKLKAVDSFIAQNMKIEPSMASPELYVMASKAMEYDKARTGKSKEVVTTIKKGGNGAVSKVATPRHNASQKALVERKLKEGKASASDLFSFLVD